MKKVIQEKRQPLEKPQSLEKRQPAIRSQHRGKTAEETVRADLTKRGHLVQLVRQKKQRIGGKTVYTERQGCDISGSTATGQALFIEVKAYEGRIPISERHGLMLHQVAFLLERAKHGAIALLAIVSPANDIFYVPIEKILDRLKLDHIKSYSLKFAVEDSVESF